MAQRLNTDTRRDQAAQAALKLAEKGACAITVQNVAQAMGVVPSALYRHFAKGKEALIDAAFHYVQKRVFGNMDEAVKDATDPVDALHRLLEMHITLVGKHPGVLHFMFGADASGQSKRLRPRVLSIMSDFRHALAQIVEQGQDQGCIRTDVSSYDIVFMFIGTFAPPFLINHLSGGGFNFKAQARRNWVLFEDAIRPQHRSTQPQERS